MLESACMHQSQKTTWLSFLVTVLLALTVIFLISQLHRTISEENKKNSLRNLSNYTKESRLLPNKWFVEMQKQKK